MQIVQLLALAVAALIPGSLAAPTLFQKPAGTKIPNQYIVVYKSGANESLIESHEAWLQTATLTDSPLERRSDLASFPKIPQFKGFSYLRKYAGENAIRGYTAKLTPEIAEALSVPLDVAADRALQTLPEVDFIEQDAVASINAVQSNAPWGLRRLSKAALPLPTGYTYPNAAGTGVNVYVIDTGVQISHPDFGGRASIGASFSSDNNNIDGNGHGTHVAGTVAGTTYGVAKRANIVAVKVLSASGSGTNSDVIAGINWVATNGPRSGR
ncbi:subtilisin-like serine protease, partial [Dinochytrium kinnereticum]